MKHQMIITIAFLSLLIACSGPQADYESAFTDEFEFFPNVLNMQTRGEPDGTPLGDAMKNYEKGNLSESLEALDSYIAENPDFYKAKFYRALILLKQREIDNAIVDLNEVLIHPGEFEAPAKWYLALAYIRAEKKQKAVNLLNELKVGNDQTYQQRANHLLENINRWPD